MKRRRPSLFFVSALLLWAIPLCQGRAQTAQAGFDYWIAGYSMNGARLAALSIVDAHSVAPTHDGMKRGTVWLFVSPLEPNEMAGWSMETSYEFNCAQRSERFLGGRSLDQNGAQVRTGGESQSWRAVRPGVMAEGALNFVCGQAPPTDAIEIGNVSPQQAAQQMFAQEAFDPSHPLAAIATK